MELPTRQPSSEFDSIDPRVKALLYTVRQALIIIIGGIEDFLGIERSITPRHKRKALDSQKDRHGSD